MQQCKQLYSYVEKVVFLLANFVCDYQAQTMKWNLVFIDKKIKEGLEVNSFFLLIKYDAITILIIFHLENFIRVDFLNVDYFCIKLLCVKNIFLILCQEILWHSQMNNVTKPFLRVQYWVEFASNINFNFSNIALCRK